MSRQFVFDENGEAAAVIVPLDEWQTLNERAGISTESPLPDWQKKALDAREIYHRKHPEKVVDFDEMMAEFDD